MFAAERTTVATPPEETVPPVLTVSDLEVSATHGSSTLKLLKGVSLSVPPGRVLGIVGETGSGKSMLIRAIQGLLAQGLSVTDGSIEFAGQDLTRLGAKARAALRGTAMTYVPQWTTTAFDPTAKLGTQMRYCMERSGGRKQEARERVARTLDQELGLQYDDLAGRYPFEVSVGQAQRTLFALGVSAARPRLVLVDEPTASLDLSSQDAVLSLVERAARVDGAAVIMVSHDLSVIRAAADDVAVMYFGRVVEQGPVDQVLSNPQHPYSIGLIRAAAGEMIDGRLFAIPGMVPSLGDGHVAGCAFAPRCARADEACTVRPELTEAGADGQLVACHHVGDAPTVEVARLEPPPEPETAPDVPADRERPERGTPLLEVRDVTFTYRPTRRDQATGQGIHDVSFVLEANASLGIVGPSGCGKSTLARCIAGLQEPSRGQILFHGDRVAAGDDERLRASYWPRVQMVWQDVVGALNPRRRVRDLIAEPLHLYDRRPQEQFEDRVLELLDMVNLPAALASYHPHELSGGQAQRVGLARALASDPELLLCDEPTSALDVSVRGHVLNLLRRLREELSLSIICISHDQQAIASICDEVLVMENGRGRVEALGA
ncbi:ABC transporter ATP-binding protein [Nocardioides bigeumensis]|uniref:ABC transporter ATP-binding protein n=1 Tax=Nocardioides bigeumensis TaxID=433657 RepID=A0ABP5JTW4_9ACTN